MMSEELITKVIFRKWEVAKKHDDSIFNGNITAVFPEIPADLNPTHCSCYDHFGQHGSCSWVVMLEKTVPATESEYADLKHELESAPYFYKFKVYKRYTAQMYDNLIAELKRYSKS